MSELTATHEVEHAHAELRSDVAAKVDFSAIRYAQGWEDPACLERALAINSTDRVLSIAAAGDNSFALLLMGDSGPERVTSVDMNPAQCALVELKRAAILTLSHAELLQFLGVRPADGNRTTMYSRVRAALPAEARAYWDTRSDLLSAGVITTGRLERFFGHFRRYMLPLTHTRRTVQSLVLEHRDPAERAIFWDETFANRRWNAMVRTFFSQFVIGKLGRDPAFFEHVRMDSVSAHYAARARHACAVLDPSTNWFLHEIYLGGYPVDTVMPPYLLESNFELLRSRLDRLDVHCAELETFLASHAPGSFTKFNLSDIFEWMSDDAYEHMLRALIRTSTAGGRLAYWNNLVLRSRPDSMAGQLRPLRDLARQIHAEDRAFLYRDFQVEEIQEEAAS